MDSFLGRLFLTIIFITCSTGFSLGRVSGLSETPSLNQVESALYYSSTLVERSCNEIRERIAEEERMDREFTIRSHGAQRLGAPSIQSARAALADCLQRGQSDIASELYAAVVNLYRQNLLPRTDADRSLWTQRQPIYAFCSNAQLRARYYFSNDIACIDSFRREIRRLPVQATISELTEADIHRALHAIHHRCANEAGIIVEEPKVNELLHEILIEGLGRLSHAMERAMIGVQIVRNTREIDITRGPAMPIQVYAACLRRNEASIDFYRRAIHATH